VTDPTFAVPRVTASALRRTRLLRTIAAAETRGSRVVLASAMAGAGKTTLFAQYAATVARSGRPVAWVSIGDQHNDRRALWRAVVSSLAGATAVAPEAAAGLARLATAAPARLLPGEVADALGAIGPACLILDDVHRLTARPALELLEVLLHERPEELRVMIAARHDPPLRLARIALDGAFHDLRFAELAFDRAETRTLLDEHEAAVRRRAYAGIRINLMGTVNVLEAARRHPGRVAVGIDAREGKVAVQGWLEASDVAATDLARRFEDAGVAAIVYTDIARDGMLEGPNLAQTAALAEAVGIPVIASGGVGTEEDVRRSCALAARGVAGLIVGRALYTGAVDLGRALEIAAAC